MAKYLLAIDAGTGSIRAVLFGTSGKQVTCVQKEWSHPEDVRYPGSMDFACSQNWDLTVSCIREVLALSKIHPSDIAAISTTCMREGFVLYNKEGQEIWACANVDARATEEVKQLLKIDPLLEKELYGLSGQSFALDAIPRLLWVKKNLPRVYADAYRLGMINDWLIKKLTNAYISEPSNACTTGIMRLSTRNWDKSILERCGLKTSLLGEVKESGSIAGTVSSSAATQTGLRVGTPVIVGGGDAQLGCIGVGVVEAGDAAVFGGSFWQYEYNSSMCQTDAEARVRMNCHAMQDLWQYEAIAFKPGLVMRWYRDAFCQAEKEEAQKCACDVYDLLNQKAQDIPAGSYGMMCTFSDIMNFTAWKHASPSFSNFDFDERKFNKYTFYRAIMENAAYVTRGHIELVAGITGVKPKEIIFASGASKSSLWAQILADVTGLSVAVPEVKEATALGAAILAGYGVGIYSDIASTAKQLVKIESRYQPNAVHVELYSELYEKWKKIYRKHLEITNAGLTHPLWSAPGL